MLVCLFFLCVCLCFLVCFGVCLCVCLLGCFFCVCSCLLVCVCVCVLVVCVCVRARKKKATIPRSHLRTIGGILLEGENGEEQSDQQNDGSCHQNSHEEDGKLGQGGPRLQPGNSSAHTHQRRGRGEGGEGCTTVPGRLTCCFS